MLECAKWVTAFSRMKINILSGVMTNVQADTSRFKTRNRFLLHTIFSLTGKGNREEVHLKPGKR